MKSFFLHFSSILLFIDNLLARLGSKSQQKASSTPVTKDEKALNPASRRVREAAENLLSVIMEQVSALKIKRKKNFVCFFLLQKKVKIVDLMQVIF